MRKILLSLLLLLFFAGCRTTKPVSIEDAFKYDPTLASYTVYHNNKDQINHNDLLALLSYSSALLPSYLNGYSAWEAYFRMFINQVIANNNIGGNYPCEPGPELIKAYNVFTATFLRTAKKRGLKHSEDLQAYYKEEVLRYINKILAYTYTQKNLLESRATVLEDSVPQTKSTLMHTMSLDSIVTDTAQPQIMTQEERFRYIMNAIFSRLLVIPADAPAEQKWQEVSAIIENLSDGDTSLKNRVYRTLEAQNIIK